MGRCDSCGREDQDTRAVQRVYLVLPTGSPVGDPQTLEDRADPVPQDDPEQWCASCRDHFPHLLAPAAD